MWTVFGDWSGRDDWCCWLLATRMPTLRSKRHGLVGRPDQIVRVGRVLIPVEQKPKTRRMQQSHVFQLAAQCLCVHEVYGVRPPYGLLVLKDGKQERAEFTPALERRLLETMEQIGGLIEADWKPGATMGRRKVQRVWFSHGFKVSPAIGTAAAARLVAGPHAAPELDEFRLQRFAESKPINPLFLYVSGVQT